VRTFAAEASASTGGSVPRPPASVVNTGAGRGTEPGSLPARSLPAGPGPAGRAPRRSRARRSGRGRDQGGGRGRQCGVPPGFGGQTGQGGLEGELFGPAGVDAAEERGPQPGRGTLA